MGHVLLSPLAFFTPPPGHSPNASEIDSLYKIILVVAVVVFLAVWGALGYALVRFRKRKGAVPAQIRGNTQLEVGWTVGAALILVALAVITFVKLPAIENPPSSGPGGDQLASNGSLLYASTERKLPPNGRALKITVIGRQFVWQYVYPGANEPDGLGAPYSYEAMVVPTKTTVSLDIVSSDVVHEWWIPELGGKLQAVPGYHSYTWFKVDQPGIYRGQCSFLCGRGHARMIATVRAVPPAQFDEWLAKQKRALSEANAAAQAARAKLAKETGAKQVETP